MYQPVGDKTYYSFQIPRFIKYGKTKGLIYLDPDFSSYELLLTAETGVVEDSSPAERTLTNPGATVSTDIAKVGSASLYFNNHLIESTAFSLGTNDFTIDGWVYYQGFITSYSSFFEYGSYPGGLLIRPSNTFNHLGFWIQGSDYTVAGVTWQTGTWYHIALQRLNNNYQLFRDGTLLSEVTGRTDNFGSLVMGVGESRHNTSQYTVGYIDHFRVVNGVAKHNPAGFSVDDLLYHNVKRLVQVGLPLQVPRATYNFLEYSLLDNFSPLMWFDAAGENVFVESGGRISQWLDSSTNGNHATQSNSSLEPFVNVTQLNDINVVTINSAPIGLNTGITLSTPYSIMLLSKNSSNGRLVQAGSGNALMCPARSTNAYYVNATVRSDATAPVDTWNIVTMIIPGTSSSQVWPADTGVNVGSGTHGTWSLFHIGSAGPYYENPNGDIAEIIVFDYALADAERQELEGYLAHKWDIVSTTLVNGHPYYNEAP